MRHIELPALTPRQFDILRDAVNIARDRQTPSTKSLIEALQQRWPQEDANITSALNFWSFTLQV